MQNDPAASPADLCIHARWVVPVDPPGKMLENHALLVRDGRISGLLPSAETGPGTAREEVRLDEHLLIPGLVNAHGHAAMTLFRGMADDLPLQQWLEGHIWPAEQRWVDAGFVRDGVRLAIGEMLRGGTTTFSDMYFFPEETAACAADAGMRAQVAFPILDFPTAWGSGPDEYLEKGLALGDQWRDHDRLRIAFGPHACYTVARAVLERIAILATETSRAVQMHVHETAGEVADYTARCGTRPLNLLDQMGLVNPRFQAVHVTQVDDADLDILSRGGAHVVHCPESNLKLASGLCPAARLADTGINVALGTDGAASNNDLDMIGEMRSAALLGKLGAGDAAALSAHQVLRMATLNGAAALGMQDDIGSLEPGKWADCVAVRLDDWQHLPVYDPVAQLVYSADAGAVTHAWVAGRPLLTERVLQTLDADEVLARARVRGASIAAD